MRVFTPEYIFRNVTHITPAFLHEQGVEALVLDVDNTLTGHGSQELGADVAAWLDIMRAAGIRMMVASNNYKKRVEPFANKIGLDYASFCCKPLPKWLRAAKRKWGLPRSHMALVGDQIFTDGLAGHFGGVRVFLVQPLAEAETFGIRLKRWLEKPFLRRYYGQGGQLL